MITQIIIASLVISSTRPFKFQDFPISNEKNLQPFEHNLWFHKSLNGFSSSQNPSQESSSYEDSEEMFDSSDKSKKDKLEINLISAHLNLTDLRWKSRSEYFRQSATDPCVCGQKQKTKIVKGKDTSIGQNPWMTQLTLKLTGVLFCAGTLITNRHILTAAHCINFARPDKILVRLGTSTRDSTDGVEFGALAYIKHPWYITVQFFDIALIMLDRDVEFTDKIRPVCLPTPGRNDFQGKSGVVTGWGRLSAGGALPDILQETTVKMMNTAQCIFNSGYLFTDILFGVLCARGADSDSCQGDSGGPLVQIIGRTVYQVGITSWGIGCNDPRFPGIYTNVFHYRNWIKTNTQSSTYCLPIDQVTRALED